MSKRRPQQGPERLPDHGPDHGEVIQPAGFEPTGGAPRPRGRRLSPVRVALGGSFLVLLGVALFLLNARSVLIQVDPAEAQVNVDGGIHLALGRSWLMLPGEYRISLRADGYHPRREALEVDDSSNQQHRFQLEKLPGHLTVRAQSAASGEIWLDGEKRGELGQRIESLAPGRYQLQVRSERYRPLSREVAIQGMNRHQELSVALEPAWTELRVETEPPGATLTVDGEARGKTPLTAEILEGQRQLTLTLHGHKPWRQLVEVTAGESRELSSIILEEADGLLHISSQPDGASITVDGEYRGLTPREVALAPGRDYQVTLFKDGFQPTQRQVRVESGQEAQMQVALDAKLGEVRVSSQPKDALLYVDGRLMGRANQVLELPAQQTTLTVKREGYAEYRTTVLPRPGFEQSVDVALKTAEEARWENIEREIETPAGQRLKLFRPEDRFTTGSSRREQGRRANEAMRDVELTRPFYMGLHEVTNREFRRFDPEHSSSHAQGESLDGEDYPVVQVSWQQAARYCNWLSEQEGLPPFYQMEEGEVTGFNPQATGYRLPTEAEWAWAARYRDDEMLKFSWGAQLPPQEDAGNLADRQAAPLVGYVQPEYDDGYPASAPVGSFPANHRGLYDLTGNVSEWVNDFYDIDVGLSMGVARDPLGPSEGAYHVIRGSSWSHGDLTELRLSFRDYGKDGRRDLGFRVARFVE